MRSSSEARQPEPEGLSQETDDHLLADILQALVREIASVGSRAERMQNIISPLLMGVPDVADHTMDLQELDLIAQQLLGISNFLANLSPPPTLRIDTSEAGRSVTLTDLARRLARPLDAEVVGDPGGVDDELVLFD